MIIDGKMSTILPFLFFIIISSQNTDCLILHCRYNRLDKAGQTVFHTHIHLLPRYDKEDGLEIHFKTNEPDFPALAQLAQSLYLGE